MNQPIGNSTEASDEPARNESGAPAKCTSSASATASAKTGMKRRGASSHDIGCSESTLTPSLWENLVAGERPACCGPCGGTCCWITSLVVILLFMLMSGAVMKLNDKFGFFVLSEPETAAYLAHFKLLKDTTYFSRIGVAVPAQTYPHRMVPGNQISIFYARKDTGCPQRAGEKKCSMSSKNLLTSEDLEKIRKTEKKIWDLADYQNKWCSTLSPNGKCRPPDSLLQHLSFGDSAASQSKIDMPYYGKTFDVSCLCQFSSRSYLTASCPKCGTSDCPSGSSAVPSTCTGYEPCSFVSPLEPNNCELPAWAYLNATQQPESLGSFNLQSSQTQSRLATVCTSGVEWSSVREKILPIIICDGSSPATSSLVQHGTPFLITKMQVGFPWKESKTLAGGLDWEDEIDDFTDEYGSDMWKDLTDIVKDVWGEQFGNDDVVVVISSPYTEGAMKMQIQMTDMMKLVSSFFLVWLYMWFNVESCFLASFGMLQVISCIAPSIVLWTIFNPSGVTFLQTLAMFLILGIGADDVFVLNDAYKQAKHELAQVGDYSIVDHFALAYRRSFFSMLSTTLTTAWAFFFGISNKIPAISEFCVFAAIIVTFDFLFCITLFAASVAFQERYMAGRTCCCCGPKPQPGSCCSPGCCFGCVRIIYRKITRTSADATTDQRLLERIFEGPLFNFVKRFRFILLIFWLLLLGGAIGLATQVKKTSKDPEALPPDHPVMISDDVRSNYFTQTSVRPVSITFGLDKEDPVSKWNNKKGEDPLTMKLTQGNVDWALTPGGQQAIYNLCTSLDTGVALSHWASSVTGTAGSNSGLLGMTENTYVVRGTSGGCAMKRVTNSAGIYYIPDNALCMSGRYCLMEQVRDFAVYNQLTTFPIADLKTTLASTTFKEYLNGYFTALDTHGQHWHALRYMDDHGSGVLLDGNTVTYLWFTFNATYKEAFQPPKEGEEIYKKWEDFVHGPLPKDKCFFVELMFLFKQLQDVILKEAIKNIFVSLAVAFLVMALVTWNWYIAVLGTFNIACITVYFVAMFPILDWELDIYNIIFLIMTVGLSVDYTVHLLHAFNESPAEGCELRMKEAFSNMGITILSGALTTLLAAIPPLTCVSTFFSRFGTFVFMCIFFSIVTAIFLLTPLVLCIGPESHFGDIHPFYWLQDHCWNKIRGKGQQESKV